MTNSVRRLTIGVTAACLAALVAAAIVFVAADPFGDSRPELTDDMVMGKWTGDEGSRFDFNEDGAFLASHIPVSLLGSREGPNPASGSGRWSVRAAVNDYSERRTQVVLVFDDLAGYPVPYSVNLRSDRVDGRVVLFWFVGDPDLGQRFLLEEDETS